jgi:signal transduction histidine kinase
MAAKTSLRRLQWLTIVVAISFLVVIQAAAMGLIMPNLGRPLGHAVSIAGFSLGIIILASILYGAIGRMQAQIVRKNEESQALYEIAVDIAALDDQKEVLRSIVDRVREMLGADTAEVLLTARSGGLEPAVHSGVRCITPAASMVGPGPSNDGSAATPPLPRPAQREISAALMVAGEPVGELRASFRAGQALSEDDTRLLSAMADLAAIEVQKGRLLERDRLVATLEERERLAREMHDSLAQVLGYIHLKSQAAERSLRSDATDQVRESLEEITSVAHEAYVDVREAILGLRETISPRRAFVDALREYATRFSQQSGVATRIDVLGAPLPDLDPAVELQLMRVVQEALTNVRKHSGARKACVSLEEGDGLRITIEDDGNGFSPDQLNGDSDHFGLDVMRERVERVGGTLEIESMSGHGTRVCVVLSGARQP